MYCFAHVSDPHVAPLPRVRLRDLNDKRLLGVLSWKLRRKAVHLEDVLALLVRDLHAQAPQHVLVTGDITNVALPEEFRRGAAWLEGIGSPQDVSVIPGNHDAYVNVPWGTSLGLWSAYMSSEDRWPFVPGSAKDFPFVRVRGPVAFVGVSTARPTGPLLATGEVGCAQLSRLEEILTALGRRGLFRVVMMHHPPTAGSTRARKRLLDAETFRALIAATGAELVVHGHTHRPSFGALDAPRGRTPVIGTPSASASRAAGDRHYARYHVYRLDASGTGPRISLEIRGLDHQGMSFVTEETRELSVPWLAGSEQVA